MGRKLKVLSIEPYFGLSHRSFLEGFQRYTSHDVTIWHLPPRKWKWRMRGSAYHFADRARKEPDLRPDVVLVSDYLNLADWRALAPRPYRDAPSVLYFHENQICYPLSGNAPVDYHYGWINLSSALAADRILFNSRFQRDGFLREVDAVLQRMPDSVPAGLVEGLRTRSGVFPVGMDFAPHEEVRRKRTSWPNSEPVVLWNHRWEFDKAPDTFVKALIDLKSRGVPFGVVICGESYGKSHEAFHRAIGEIGGRIRHIGFVPEASRYRELVAQCDVVVSTARHEFFGVSVVEAIFLGCLPVLPNALSYPEIIPPHLHPLFLYSEADGLADFLEEFFQQPPIKYADELFEVVEQFHWKHLAPRLDGVLDETAG